MFGNWSNLNFIIRIKVSRNKQKLFQSLVCIDEHHTSGSMKGVWLKGRLAGWICFKTVTQVCLPFFFLDIYANPVGHAATPHCFAHLAKLKSVKQVKFFFPSNSGLPPFWVTAADMAHVHHLLKHNLSYDSSADVAQTQTSMNRCSS